jgi:pimeloyl-ACP methyl ester carboxylesterase
MFAYVKRLTPLGRASVPAMSDLACSLLGHGRPFVWGHGLTSSRANEDQRRLFDWSRLSDAGTQVVRYDARGHGQTGGPADPSAYEWTQLADDLLALMDHLDIDRAAAGGASMGCASLLHAAVRAPERFERLVLVIPPTAWETRPAQATAYEASASYVEEAGKAAWMAAADCLPKPAIFDVVPPTPFDADISEELLPFVLRGAAASDLPAPDALAALDHPALVLAWTTDPGHPVSTAERLAELLPNAELHVAETLAEVLTWSPRVADFLA